MADRYLLESGAPDGYLLEDSSGVLLLEDGLNFGQYDPDPVYGPKLRKSALLATIGLVAPLFVASPDAAVAGNSVITQERSVQYQSLAFVPFVETAPEEITLDKWYQPTPYQPRRFHPQHINLAAPVTLVGLSTGWFVADIPLQRPIPVRHHSQAAAPIFTPAAAPEVITLDKWLTASPYRIPIPRGNQVLEVLANIEPLPGPPIPPEPEPEPPPAVQRKPMRVQVRHIGLPRGGFNTIYEVVDDE